MFVNKAGAYLREVPFRWSTLDRLYKYYTKLERPAKDKHFSLLQKVIDYVWEKFYTSRPSYLTKIC